MILNEEDFENKIDQEIPDVEVPDLEVPDIVPETPEEGPDMGIANLLHDLIIAEHEAIQNYNVTIANLDTHKEFIPIMQEIANDKMNHIGKLEQALSMLSPNAESIMDGAIEAKEELKDSENPEAENTEEEVKESFISKKYNAEFIKKLDESIISSYTNIDANELAKLKEADALQVLKIAPAGAKVINVIDRDKKEVELIKVVRVSTPDFNSPVHQERNKFWLLNGTEVSEKHIYRICIGADITYGVK